MERQEMILSAETEAGWLTLDPSVLKEQRHGEGSVADGYGVGVFTDEFRMRMEIYENEQQKSFAADQVFVERMNREEGKRLEEQMFRTPLTIAAREHDTAQRDAIPALYLWTFGIVSVLFAVFLYRYQRRRRKSSDHNDSPETLQ